ncbi:acetoin utilization protein AcuC [Deinococcus cellulosilyticus]|uniref:Acetoin utilization protein AcuC n=1 Tax=Deinococcus cellulosilyticus (strain DSM 18568 / NBRC 106333 / KACC 11606 / 5516J-15) TaxID=1223518 RepID=A0A511MZI9_DEIC1|nr:acetoin utilization protein AcuC [Deinococcus cellulosilyticus]GEM45962.1 acetoin utilization protein AcuC [Deinococcus cellulosilyticus NBRC 106333 = KACC 11606]
MNVLTPTAFIYSSEYQKYKLGPDHPFKSIRGELTLSLLRELNAIRDEDLHLPLSITDAELMLTHAKDYVNMVKSASVGEHLERAREFGLDTTDTPTFPDMHEATLSIVGGTVKAVELVMDGTYKRAFNVGGGLHHAQHRMAAGFCVYNDLSVAARRLSMAGYKVAYLDIDAHHGDGVQMLHYHDRHVLTISLHESGRYLWPGTGSTYELGQGDGSGYSLNVPLEPYTQDHSFLEVMDLLLPEAFEWFQPDVLLLQAGCDPHQQDPLADLCLTVQGMSHIYERIVRYADTYCSGRIVATGGGGYATYNVAPRAWALLYLALSGQPVPEVLPESWREAWLSPNPTEDPIPAHWWDDAVEIPRKQEIEHRNRRTVERLLRDWRDVRK